MTEINHNERLHAMDALRAVAMLLGVVLHGGMAYMLEVWPVWAADDASSNLAFTVGFTLIHQFRMHVFFLVAGFFACMLVARYGTPLFLRHRLLRIGLPLLIGFVTIVPLGYIVWTWGFTLRISEEYRPALVDAVIDSYKSRPWITNLHPWHLWFLLHLLVLYAIAVGWLWVAGKLAPLSRFGDMVTGAWVRCVRRGLAAPMLAAMSFPLLFLQSGPGVDTQEGPIPDMTIIAFYSIFFFAGWMLYRQREHLASLGRFWILWLAIGLGLVPVFMAMYAGIEEIAPSGYVLMCAVSATSTAGLVVGFTGLFLRFFNRHSKLMRYLSDSAYWVYIVHLPLVVAMNLVFLPLKADAFTKFGLVMLTSCVIMYASYQLFVRYTIIGVLLNGPRLREERRERRVATASTTTA